MSTPSHEEQSYPRQPHPTPGGVDPKDEQTWSVVAHLSAPILYVLSAGWLGVLAPLGIWAAFKDRSPMIRAASAGSFNFNLTLLAVTAVLYLFGFVTLGLGFLLVIPALIVIGVIAVAVHVVAAIKASRGEVFHYPLQIPVLR